MDNTNNKDKEKRKVFFVNKKPREERLPKKAEQSQKKLVPKERPLVKRVFSGKSQTKDPAKAVGVAFSHNTGSASFAKNLSPNSMQTKEPARKIYLSNGKPTLKVIFLGGVGEVGKNLTVLECGQEMIIIDGGVSFADESIPGIRQIIPNFNFLKQNKHKIKGLIVTHAHEDHIGGLPYILKELGNVPVFATGFTLAIIERKLSEFKGIKLDAVTVKPRTRVALGCFNIEFLRVNHSIAGSLALGINTPIGYVLHTGDFKIDYSPTSGDSIDLPRFAEYGNRGVTLLLCESTNAMRDGFVPSEKLVEQTLSELFKENAHKRITITAFATSTYRLKTIFELCEANNRKMCFIGRSMVTMSEIAAKMGEFKLNAKNVIEVEQLKNYKDSEVCLLTTGSQGEPLSALTRIANDEVPKIKLGTNDCVIFSSSPIPGNERDINKVVNLLFKKGVTVVTNDLALVHVSGHACREELKVIHKLVKPKFFIPVHGEYKHLKMHGALATSLGQNTNDIYIPDIGHVVEVERNSMRFAGFVESGIKYIDGDAVVDSDTNVIEERRMMAEGGVCTAIVAINTASGSVVGEPNIITKGLVYDEEVRNGIIGQAKEMLINTIKGTEFKNNDLNEVRNTLRRSLQGFFTKKLKRRPVVIMVLVDSR